MTRRVLPDAIIGVKNEFHDETPCFSSLKRWVTNPVVRESREKSETRITSVSIIVLTRSSSVDNWTACAFLGIFCRMYIGHVFTDGLRTLKIRKDFICTCLSTDRIFMKDFNSSFDKLTIFA